MPPSKSFASLNADQARAAQHGADGPLLIIAGAGSGKTQTLAHRVAYLIEQGADPGRILLLFPARRPGNGAEGQAHPPRTRQPGDGLHWLVRHLARDRRRLLRQFAHSVGLNPAFTIHDREDSTDLLNLVRISWGSPNRSSVFR